MTTKTKNMPSTMENTFRPIRADNFESRNQREHSSSAQSMPLNPYDFSANNTQPDPQMRMGMTRQLSVPVDNQMQMMQHQMPISQQHPMQTADQRQMNAPSFDMPHTSLHRPQSETLPNSFSNSPMLSSSMSLRDYNVHGGANDDSIFNPLMMDSRSNMLANPDSQYNPQSVENLNIYAASRNELLDTPVFGTAPVTSHLSIDGNNAQQSINDMQRPMSLPPYGNQQGQPNQQQDQMQNNQWW